MVFLIINQTWSQGKAMQGKAKAKDTKIWPRGYSRPRPRLWRVHLCN